MAETTEIRNGDLGFARSPERDDRRPPRLVELRMSRQQRLVLDTPVELSAIIDEGALRREVGGPDVMRVLGVSDMVAGASLTAAELPGVAWHISTRSGSGSGNCVEAGTILDGSGRFAVRHSHHPDSHVLVYASVDWAAFLAIIRAGRLN